MVYIYIWFPWPWGYPKFAAGWFMSWKIPSFEMDHKWVDLHVSGLTSLRSPESGFFMVPFQALPVGN